MKRFAAVYTGTPNSPKGKAFHGMDEKARNEKIAAGMKAWHEWGAKHANVTLYEGGPLGKTKRVNENGVADVSNNLSGITIIEAESHEAAAKLFENHPHFAIFPGDAVEIMEIMPIPQM